MDDGMLLLQRKLDESRINVTELCSMLGITRASWYRKIGGYVNFTIKEMYILIDVLSLSVEERDKIFCPLCCINTKQSLRNIEQEEV